MPWQGEPEIHDLSETDYPRTWAALREGVADEVAPGFVAGIWDAREPNTFRIAAVGKRRVFPSELAMLPDTTFDLASLTKVFGTATLAALLIDRGWLRWEDEVSSILPGYAFPGVRISHLLSHTAGYAAWAPFWEDLRAHFGPRPLHLVSVSERQLEMRRRVLATAPEAPIATRALYSDLSFLVLGFCLEEITRMPLDQAMREFVWKPMGLNHPFYRRVIGADAASSRMEQVAATEDSQWRGGVLQGQVHDDNCWAMGGYGGHAGAFARAQDVLVFVRKLMSGFLTQATLAKSWSRPPAPKGCGRTLGWDTPTPGESSAGSYFSASSVGHLGYTGTSLWIDPEARIAITLLSNRVHPSRENIRIRAFRPRFHDALRIDSEARFGPI